MQVHFLSSKLIPYRMIKWRRSTSVDLKVFFCIITNLLFALVSFILSFQFVNICIGLQSN